MECLRLVFFVGMVNQSYSDSLSAGCESMVSVEYLSVVVLFRLVALRRAPVP